MLSLKEGTHVFKCLGLYFLLWKLLTGHFSHSNCHPAGGSVGPRGLLSMEAPEADCPSPTLGVLALGPSSKPASLLPAACPLASHWGPAHTTSLHRNPLFKADLQTLLRSGVLGTRNAAEVSVSNLGLTGRLFSGTQLKQQVALRGVRVPLPQPVHLSCSLCK